MRQFFIYVIVAILSIIGYRYIENDRMNSLESQMKYVINTTIHHKKVIESHDAGLKYIIGEIWSKKMKTPKPKYEREDKTA